MSITKNRTSFALDEETMDLLRRLSRRWNVSLAEVVRRSVRLAAHDEDSHGETVRERLEEYRKGGRLSPSQADSYLAGVAEDRSAWGRDR